MLSVVLSCSCCCASAPTCSEQAAPPTPPDSELSDGELPLAAEKRIGRRYIRRQHVREFAYESRGLI
eukprot:6256640-Alexandrium_andersonii.AAC.1